MSLLIMFPQTKSMLPRQSDYPTDQVIYTAIDFG